MQWPAVVPSVVVAAATIVVSAWPPVIGEPIARLRRGDPLGRPHLVAVEICSPVGGACSALPVDHHGNRANIKNAVGSTTGLLRLTFDTDPRTWRTVRVTSLDGNCELHDGSGDRSSVQTRVYGRAVSIRYSFRPSKAHSDLSIESRTWRGIRLRPETIPLEKEFEQSRLSANGGM